MHDHFYCSVALIKGDNEVLVVELLFIFNEGKYIIIWYFSIVEVLPITNRSDF